MAEDKKAQVEETTEVTQETAEAVQEATETVEEVKEAAPVQDPKEFLENFNWEKYEQGIFQKYLRTKQLIISEKSFGETTASSNISDDLNDRRNSVYSVPAAKERRVEIIEIISDKF